MLTGWLEINSGGGGGRMRGEGCQAREKWQVAGNICSCVHVFKYLLQSAKLMQGMNPSVGIAMMHDSSIKTWA